jgi:hypothetical protein
MRRVILLAAAFLLTITAIPRAHAAQLPPHNTCWILVCDSEGVCVAKEIFC